MWQQEIPPGWALASAALALALALLSAIDLYEYRLPDVLTLPLAVLGLAVTPFVKDTSVLWQAGSAAVAFALMAGIARAYEALRGRPGLGLGDAKLMAASGAWVGAEGLPTVLLWACGAAIAAILIRTWRTGPPSGTAFIPFGPFLAFGTWLVWLYWPA